MAGSYLDIANWQPLGSQQYRTVRLYERMRWGEDFELEEYTVCGAPYGGPLALARDTRKLTTLRSSSERISLYDAAGKLLALVPMESSGRLISMGWSASELLYCIYSTGVVEVFDVLGSRIPDRCFNLLPSLSGDEVTEAAMPWAGDGLAAQVVSPDGLYSLVRVDGLEFPRPEAISDIGLPPGTRHTCMACIDAACTSTGRMEVLLGTKEGSIAVLDGDGRVIDQGLEGLLGAVPAIMSVSPQGAYVACFGEDGTLQVIDTGFSRKGLEFDTKAGMPPSQVLWCGADAVVLAWPDRGVLVVGPYGDWIKLEGEEAGGIVAVQEMDCVRLVSATTHEMLQLVPGPLMGIRSIGSTAPGALLTDAASAFSEGDARCDETVRSLVADDVLADAVGECVQAAGHEWDTGAQRALLRAAAYGKSFEPSFSKDIFVESAQRLRVMNQLRDADIGLPLTQPQYDAVTPAVLVDRLAARHLFRLALDVAEYLSIPGARDRILVAWAVAKVQTAASAAQRTGTQSYSDEALRDLIRARLGAPGSGASNVSYADIAAAADSAGRRRLATLLLDFEPRAADQVPILLRMGEGRLALSKALDSGDPDLAYTALLHLRASCRVEAGQAGRSRPGGAEEGKGKDKDRAAPGGPDDPVLGPLDPADPDADFLRLVLSYPAAVDLLANWASVSDRGLQLKLYLASGRFAEAGRLSLEAAYRHGRGAEEAGDDGEEEEDNEHFSLARSGGPGLYVVREALKARIGALKRAADIFREGEKRTRLPPADRSECAFLARSTDEQVALLLAQASIEADLDGNGDGSDLALIGSPLNATLLNLWLLGDVGGWAKRADKMVKDLKVPDGPATLVKVRALAKSRDWPALWAFANERRSPVGYRPFAEACALEGSVAEAKKYAMQKITEPGEKIDTLVALGAIPEAAETALKAKDGERLAMMMGKAVTPAHQDAVERALAALG